MLFFKLFSYLPLRILYIFADIFYFFVFYVIRYRKKVVEINLAKSFPEKTKKERLKIKKAFYRHLINLIVETLKSLNISAKSLRKRVKFLHLEVLENKLEARKSVMVMATHHGNWEWMLLGCGLHLNYPIDAVYKPLRNRFFNHLMLRIRSRFGAKPVAFQNILKEVFKKLDKPHILALVADQSPAGNPSDYWTTFLNQETAFYTGPEKIALKAKYSAVFVGMRCIRRGYYEVFFEEIANSNQSISITKIFVEKTEQLIQQQPTYWLWSHKRWKLIRKKTKSGSLERNLLQ